MAPIPTTSTAGIAAAPAAAAAGAGTKAIVPGEDLNVPFATLFNFILAIMLVLFLLFVSPRLSQYLSSGRFSQVPFLRKSQIKRKIAARISRLSRDFGHKFELQAPPPPPATRAANAAVAQFSAFYNSFLLPEVPLIGLTVGQVIVLAAYTILVVVFTFLSTDVTVNRLRPGFISIAQIPVVILLACKNSAATIVGKGYEKLNYLHRFSGRALFVCGALHSILYLRKMTSKQFADPVHITGIVAFVALVVIFLTSLKPVRKFCYTLFFVSHTVGYIAFVVGVYQHIESSHPYVYAGAAFFFLDRLLKIAKTRHTKATLLPLPDGMTAVKVHDISTGWRAGQHVFLKVWTKKRFIGAHPFTIANAPASVSPILDHTGLLLMVKGAGDWTKGIHRDASEPKPVADVEKQDMELGKTVSVSIEGPYGGPMYHDFALYESVFLVAGGSGASFAVSTLEDLVGQAMAGKADTKQVGLVWTVRNAESVSWFAETLNNLVRTAKASTTLSIKVVIHITGGGPNEKSEDVGIEGSSVFYSRPDVQGHLDSILRVVHKTTVDRGDERGGGLGVGCCGPAGLVKQIRSAVGRVDKSQAQRVGGIYLHSECFGW